MNGSVATKWRLEAEVSAGRPRARPTTCVMNRIGSGCSPRAVIAFWRRSRLLWQSGQATTMASAPLRARVLDDGAAEPQTELVRLTLKAPPQHSTFMFQSTSSAPQALMMSSI